MQDIQKEQDSEYELPYHYIPQYRNGFSQSLSWSWGKNYISAIEFVLKKMKETSYNLHNIADVGCGDGRLTKELTKEFPNNSVLGIDYSQKAINLAKALNTSTEFIRKDIVNENLDTTFDAITLIEVFEHIPISLCDDFVRALHDLLNEKGKIFLTVPHQNKKLSYKHYQHFNQESLINYFKNLFKIDEIVFFDKQTRWTKIIDMVLINKYFILNNKRLNNYLYNIYKRKFFFCNEKQCGRIFLMMTKK
jgi:SAM-dependent methyltransferase